MDEPRAQKSIVFYDGSCGLCHGFVRFLLSRDPDGSRFLYAPLYGHEFRTRLKPEQIAGIPDSIVVLAHGEGVLLRSQAVRFLLRELGGSWGWLSQISRIVPTVVLDRAYDFVAAIRKKLFAIPKSNCPLLPPELRQRFLLHEGD